MKKLLLIFAILLLEGTSMAAVEDAALPMLFVAGAAGGSATVVQEGQLGRLPEDMPDWSSPLTAATTHIEQQCGVITELRLLRTGLANMVFLGIRNNGKKDVVLQADRVRLRFSDGTERFVLSGAERTKELKKNWYMWGVLVLPSKSDFKGKSQVEVSVPMTSEDGSSCEVKTSFQRNAEIPEDPFTSLTAASIITNFSGVGSLSMGGRYLDALGDRVSGFELGIAGYPQLNSGLFFTFGSYNFSNIKQTSFWGEPAITNARSTDFIFGKSYRFFHTEKFTSTVNAGLYWTAIEGRKSDNSNADIKPINRSYFGIYASYSADLVTLRSLSSAGGGDILVGLSLFGKFLPWFDSASPQSGTMAGVTIDFKFGR